MSSREVVERVLRAGREQDVEAFVALMAPEGYIEWPFRPAGVPGRVQGHAELRRHLTEAANALVTIDEHRDLVLHESTDPEVVVVEYEAHGTVVATGAPFEQTVIAVFRVRDGLVVSYRDYINPLRLLAALDEGNV
ncbi:nuclear transport factor 2 family protein [Micromonospora sp. WMMC241]|uniref:nuclear transport factor 2 family protein n=1 Tax=Micromonospora sp. WMMC241 TaxID=3015159 RepID=UPI0022B6F10F|nr:nuclear transport factor 2 family protein [Micromonospora sp. WMMC241]MCZ7437602.1 nuclear transport factor 2 family protein [Micromonospora sp. WMMC241]